MSSLPPVDSNRFQLNDWNAIQTTPATASPASGNPDGIPSEFLLKFDQPGQSQTPNAYHIPASPDINNERAS
jgi:hypothetical protein